MYVERERVVVVSVFRTVKFDAFLININKTKEKPFIPFRTPPFPLCVCVCV